MNRLFSALLPPLAQAVYFQWRGHRTLRYLGKTYVGVFRSFDEVRRNFHEPVAYNSPESEREQVAGLEATRAALERAKRGEPQPANDRLRLLALLVAASKGSAPHILDVGGGTADALPYLAYACAGKAPRLTVCELAPLVHAASKVFGDLPVLRYVESIEASGLPEIAFFGSSIQYFDDWRAVLAQAIALKPRILAIVDSPMTEAPTFVTAQVNMARRIIPTRIINQRELKEYVTVFGFSLIHQSLTGAAAHFRNFPAPQRDSAVSTLVFQAVKLGLTC